ncbi:MAG: Ig-like domain-containing protein [Eubacteriales bacterium]
MKKSRILAVFLMICLLCSALSFQVLGEDEEPQEEGPVYVEDTVIMQLDYSSGVPLSSGTASKWNRFHPKTYLDTIDDPWDDQNEIGRFFAASSSGATKSLLDFAGEFVVATDLLIPPPLSGAYPSPVQITLSSAVLLRFDYDEVTEEYQYTLGTQTGKYAPGTWLRIMIYGAPDAESGFSNTGLLTRVYGAAGALTDATGEPVTVLTHAQSGFSYTTKEFIINFTMPKEADVGFSSEGGFYLDDTIMYGVGDFQPGALAVPHYQDGARNVRLDGVFTIAFNHDLDLATFDSTAVRVYDGTGEDHAAVITFAPEQPDRLQISFASNPLSTYSDYYIDLGEGVRDITGRALPESLLSFSTMGIEGAAPLELPLIEPPEGGYIMPDRYNTGYRCAEEELVNFYTKYPLLSGGDIVITEAIAQAYNYEFSYFTLTNATIRVTAHSPVHIHDFYHDAAERTYGIVNNGSARLTVSDGEAVGSGSAFFMGKNLTMERIFCHDARADHIKTSSGQILLSCYIRDGGTRNPGAHADGLQISGNSQTLENDIRILGNRFDLPPMAYEHAANAAIFVKSEEGTQGVSNLQISGNWLNGGGYTVYLTAGYVGAANMHHITYTDNQYGCGRRYADINMGGLSVSDLKAYENNRQISTVSVGSILYYDGGTTGTRIGSLDELTGDSLTTLVSLANYTNVAREYTVVVRLLDESGQVVCTATKTESIRRNMHTSSYLGSDNTYTAEVLDKNGNPVTVTMLLEYPDLPSDEMTTLTLEDLPADLTGLRVEVGVYDGTGTQASLVRSSALAESVTENPTLTPDPEPQEDPDEVHRVQMQALQALLDAFEASNSMTARYAALEAALEGYEAVSDKARADAVDAYAQLTQYQADYQDLIDAYHRQYEQALLGAAATIDCSAARAALAEIGATLP